MKLTTIPFSGFYHSIHDGNIATELSSMLADDSGTPRYDLINEAYGPAATGCDFRQVHEAYSREYCKRFTIQLGLDGLVFESLRSPREYNFSTDRIFATVTDECAAQALQRVNIETLADVADAVFRSRGGFSSFYNPDWETWGDVDTWDHNQLGALFLALAIDQEGRHGSSGGLDNMTEHEIIEGWVVNGGLTRAIEEAWPAIVRLYRINGYLNERLSRSYRATC